MTTPTYDQLVLGGVAVVSFCSAVFERFVNRKKSQKTEADQQLLEEAKVFKERGDLLLAQVAEYKKWYEDEKQAHQQTREYHHDQSAKAQEKLSRCNEKCQELQGRTDISRVEQLLVNQTTALMSIGAGVQKLLERQ